MQLHTFETTIPYSDVDRVLATVKRKIKELRNQDPKIKLCKLVDVGMKNHNNGINVILYFADKPVKKGSQLSIGSS